MKKLATLALILAFVVPTLAAQPAADFSGKWEGTFTIQMADGTEGPSRQVTFTLTHKGEALTGTAGPPDDQSPLAKGSVVKGVATFQVQDPDGPLFKFTLKIVKDRLQGDMVGETGGVARGTAKVDAARSK